jgi:AraC-like DNA-binding protein
MHSFLTLIIKQSVMAPNVNFTLVDPVGQNLAFRIRSFEDDNGFRTVQRNPFSSIIWIKEGKGKLQVDFTGYPLQKDSVLFLSPFQPFVMEASSSAKGLIIDFHSDFFCLLKHQKEAAFCGLLFNNIYDPPFITLSNREAALFELLTEQMIEEVQKNELAQHELLVSTLKIMMIHSCRLRLDQQASARESLPENDRPFVLQELKDAIDKHYKEKRSASDYAAVLNVSLKALAKITKLYFNKTLTDLISERIVIEAKRDLYMTTKQVKEIAYDLGFKDEYHFSRYFKNSTTVSPQTYRKTLRPSLSQ